ncbi:MAG: hypothetical protein M3O85_06005 [Acidobacteriota bacterium]|nr:hypothetical protein [Acidobacteriota bacterium]
MDAKRILLRTGGFGAGFAVAACALIAAAAWYSSRPHPPKPWDFKAITAEYDYVTAEGDKNTIAFYYTLQNNTDLDYKVLDGTFVSIGGKLAKQNSLSILDQKFVKGDFPIFVPAHGRARFSISVAYEYPIREKADPSDDESYNYHTELSKFVVKQMGNLDGFVMFDEATRYQVIFPNGWKTISVRPPKPVTPSN